MVVKITPLPHCNILPFFKGFLKTSKSLRPPLVLGYEHDLIRNLVIVEYLD